MGLVEIVSAIHPALKARLLPDGVAWSELRRDHPQDRGQTVREYKRLEYRPEEVWGVGEGTQRLIDS